MKSRAKNARKRVKKTRNFVYQSERNRNAKEIRGKSETRSDKKLDTFGSGEHYEACTANYDSEESLNGISKQMFNRLNCHFTSGILIKVLLT